LRGPGRSEIWRTLIVARIATSPSSPSCQHPVPCRDTLHGADQSIYPVFSAFGRFTPLGCGGGFQPVNRRGLLAVKLMDRLLCDKGADRRSAPPRQECRPVSFPKKRPPHKPGAFFRFRPFPSPPFSLNGTRGWFSADGQRSQGRAGCARAPCPWRRGPAAYAGERGKGGHALP
jgi:hypothetical protein